MRTSPEPSDPLGPGPKLGWGPWRTNLLLFIATALSVFVTAVLSDREAALAMESASAAGPWGVLLAPFRAPGAFLHGLQFTGALLTILVAHELGHFIAARWHRVDASLPFFIPAPLLSPFGTMGAVIRMRGVIPTRAALLDIGASGPLAGLVFAFPMYFWGAAHSRVVPIDSPDMVELGESLALRWIDRLAAPHVPEGFTLELSPVAFAAWAGMFVTMINLIPVAQLDGGHVAYALFGTRQDRFSAIVHRSMLAFFFVSVASFLFRDLRAGIGFYRVGLHVQNSLFWLVWFHMLAILGSLGRPSAPEPGAFAPRSRALGGILLLVLASLGRGRAEPLLWGAWFLGLGLMIAMDVRGGALRNSPLLDHPPTGAAPLGPVRTAVAVVTLAMFVLLFMPTPIAFN